MTTITTNQVEKINVDSGTDLAFQTLTIEEVAAMFGVKPATLKGYLRKKPEHYPPVLPNKKRFSALAVKKYFEQQQQAEAKAVAKVRAFDKYK